MAEDIAALRAERVALKKAMRSGALIVRHGDKHVEYRTMAEMREALADIDNDIAEAGGTKRKRVFYINNGRAL